jgi:hypothetical protein
LQALIEQNRLMQGVAVEHDRCKKTDSRQLSDLHVGLASCEAPPKCKGQQ